MKFNKKIFIGNREISERSRTFIIAEAGVNHNGDMQLAKQLVDQAVACGVDAVKFQAYKTNKLILDGVDKADYQKKTTNAYETQTEMLSKLELSKDNFSVLKKYAESRGVVFLCTPFEEDSLQELEELGVSAYKVSATDITNLQFLKKVASMQKPIILSAGMCYLEEVEKALETIAPINKQVILLQCTSNYPIADTEANLSVINTFKEKFDMLVGYSDHSSGIGASPYAVALGACTIEKHFTLDKSMEGPDHLASLEPDELKRLVMTIRKVEQYMGDGKKMPTSSEQDTRRALQKCFVAKSKIHEGEAFTDDNVVAKRTQGQGISAIYYNDVVGVIAKRDYQINEIVSLS